MDTYNVSQALDTNQKELERLQGAFDGITTDISLSNKDWRELMESGALASLSISRYRGHKSLSSADLGISQEEYKEVESIVSLGFRLLLPKAVLGAFNSLESNARQVLRRYTLKVPTGYFLPASAYQACAGAMQDHKSKFDALVAQLLDDLDMHERTVLEQYTVLADQVSTRLYNAGVITYGERWEKAQEFKDRCMATFPTAEELADQFSFRLSLAFVPVPYQANQEAPQYAQASADLLALRKAVLEEQSRVQAQEVTGFIKSIQSEVYALVNESLSAVLSTAQDKSHLQSRSIVQLRGLIERLGQMNFWGDAKLDLIKQEITAILDREPSKRNFEIDQALLSAMQSEVQLTLRSIGTVERGALDMSQPAPAPISMATGTRQEPIKIAPAPARLPLPASALANRANNGKLF